MFGHSWNEILFIAGVAFAVDVIGDVTGLRGKVAGLLSSGK